jgi:hypothetical protein
MTNTNALKDFATEEQILECLILFEQVRKMEAAKLLASYMFPKWQVSTLEAFGILQNVYKEWSISSDHQLAHTRINI